MRIRYLSDLHMEFTDYLPSTIPSVGEDVVILSGDIGVGVQGVHWACRAFAGRPVVYVLGNHEYYSNHFENLPYEARASAGESNVHVLEDESISIGGVRFLGTTLWTDFCVFGSHRQSHCMAEAANSMTDYHRIRTGPRGMARSLTPADTLARHKESRAWLEREIRASAEPCVVVTHHSPSFQTCEAEYRNELLTAAFVCNAEALFRSPVKAWIYGHTHQTLKYDIGGIPLLTNQRGYPSENVIGFSWDTVFDIDV